MSYITKLGGSLVLGLALVAGCNKDETKDAAKDAANKTSTAVDKAADKTKDAAKDAGAAMSNAADKAKDAVKDAAQGAKDATKTPTPAIATNDAATKDAQSLMDKATQYIKDKKFDDADAAIKKLQGMKSSLPADWASKIDALSKSLDAAKATSGTLPALPK